MFKINYAYLFSVISEKRFENFLLQYPIRNFIERIQSWRQRKEIGFFDLANMEDPGFRYQKLLADLIPDFDTLIVIGIGGSSLGIDAIYQAFRSQIKIRYYCLDNLSSAKLQSVMNEVNPKKCIINVISKSGTTPETMANFMVIWKWYKQLNIDCRKHFVFTTDPEDGVLNQIANSEKIQCLVIPKNVGGRFSIFTDVGFFPSFLFGLKISDFIQGMKEIERQLYNEDYKHNPCFLYAAWQFYLLKESLVNETVLLPYASELKEFGAWFAQLWAESLGKKFTCDGQIVHSGLTPIYGVGANDQHSTVQLFMEGPANKSINILKVLEKEEDFTLENPFVQVNELSIYHECRMQQLLNYEADATAYSFAHEKRYVFMLEIQKLDERHFANVIYFYEVVTAIMSLFMNINAFDQPGVEAGKIATKALLGDPKYASIKADILSF